MSRPLCILYLLCCLSCNLSFAQSVIPYSRFGLGVLQSPTPAFLRGWADQSAAFHSPFNLNFMNPASYGYLSTTTFETGLYGSRVKVSSEDSSAAFTDGGLATLALGFPVLKNKLGVSFGLKPFSRVNYEIVQFHDSSGALGATQNTFEGSGGLYSFYLGSGFKWKGLSFGMNAEYLFGKMDYTTILAFPDTQNAYNTLRDESRSVKDIVFTGGVQYRISFGSEKKYALDLGVTGNLKTNVKATHDLMYVRFTYPFGVEDPDPIPKDTISDVSNGGGNIVIPTTMSGGLMFSKVNYYMIGVSYYFGKWSDYSSFGEKDFTGDTWKVSVGAQVVPDFKSYNQYLKVIAYRLGFSVGTNYLTFDGKNLPEYEADFGFGFPLKRVLSEISITGEWSHLGSLDENPLELSTFRMTLGITLNDRWFQKRKYD